MKESYFNKDINIAFLKDRSIWYDSWREFKKYNFSLICITIMLIYTIVSFLSFAGLLEHVFVMINKLANLTGVENLLSKEFLRLNDWNSQVASGYQPPSFQHILGTDMIGRSVLRKLLLGAGISMFVGVLTALTSVVIGTLLGLIAGYVGGIVDEIIVWLYSTISSVPYILLLIALTYILGRGLTAVCLALAFTNWVYTARLVRGEFIKHKNRDYVVSAEAIGATHIRKIIFHILPNVLPIILISFSLRFVSAIKAEVILSYLGVGIQNYPSWGIMISDSRSEILNGVWWQLVFTSLAIFSILLAFNIVTDLLRDAWDPKLRGTE